MSKAFFKEDTPPDDDEDFADANPVPAGSKNYMTPAGHARLQAEFDQLWKVERPKMVETVAWAASNGDRSENGDYLYGKKRLREIDRRLRFLGNRLDNAEVVDPTAREVTDQVFFGATVDIVDVDSGDEQTVSIVGIDEADAGRGRISWVSPMARALTKAREGDAVTLRTPAGDRHLEVTAVRYEALE
ncbi:MAG: transcription elongation factor GreB [Rhodocyclaceae bacterium]|nr:transcription elongation factor GreB [Rhodocyclaceae bacterium]